MQTGIELFNKGNDAVAKEVCSFINNPTGERSQFYCETHNYESVEEALAACSGSRATRCQMSDSGDLAGYVG